MAIDKVEPQVSSSLGVKPERAIARQKPAELATVKTHLEESEVEKFVFDLIQDYQRTLRNLPAYYGQLQQRLTDQFFQEGDKRGLDLDPIEFNHRGLQYAVFLKPGGGAKGEVEIYRHDPYVALTWDDGRPMDNPTYRHWEEYIGVRAYRAFAPKHARLRIQPDEIRYHNKLTSNTRDTELDINSTFALAKVEGVLEDLITKDENLDLPETHNT